MQLVTHSGRLAVPLSCVMAGMAALVAQILVGFSWGHMRPGGAASGHPIDRQQPEEHMLDIVLRSDAVDWDLGYTRSVQRPDGRIVTVYYCVTVYYYNDDSSTERYIGATIWTP